MIESLMQTLVLARRGSALVHCITNPISITQCANAILALGCRPMMAEHPRETAEITRTAGALLLNLGNLTDARIRSMKISARTARAHGIPIVLDAVGVSCSTLRRRLAHTLLRRWPPTVLKGNYSEIFALYRQTYTSRGVDADDALDMASVERAAMALARTYGCVVLASGKVDLVMDGSRTLRIANGTPQLAQITGTGCMLGAVTAALLTGGGACAAAAAACGVMGIAGERAQNEGRSGSFSTALLDAISRLQPEDLRERLRLLPKTATGNQNIHGGKCE